MNGEGAYYMKFIRKGMRTNINFIYYTPVIRQNVNTRRQEKNFDFSNIDAWELLVILYFLTQRVKF